MKFISFVFALIQISYVEPRYVLVPPCQCRVNFISPAAQVHRVESCPKPALSIPHEGCFHEYRSNAAIPELHTSRTNVHSKVYPQQGPEFHDERISYERDYYPGHYKENLEIDSIFYEDEDHELRHRRSVLSEDEHHHHHHHHHHVNEEDYSKYIADWEDEENEGEGVEDELTEELNSEVESSDEGGEAVSDTVWKQHGDLELANVVGEANVKSIEKEKYKDVANKQGQNTEVMEQGSDEINSKNGENPTIGKKTKRSINDQQFRSQYRPTNQGYCTVQDRYSKNGNNLGRHPNVHADDCTISKNLFFGCDKELEDENMKKTQRKARKVPKTLTEKINELKLKNKNKAKLPKSKAGSKTKKVNKLENSLKRDNRLRNKRKDEEERLALERELEAATASCPCGFDRNGACSCHLQPYYNPVTPSKPMYFENPMTYPVRRVYHQYAQPMPFHGYYRH